jgi:hypothetical protein
VDSTVTTHGLDLDPTVLPPSKFSSCSTVNVINRQWHYSTTKVVAVLARVVYDWYTTSPYLKS